MVELGGKAMNTKQMESLVVAELRTCSELVKGLRNKQNSFDMFWNLLVGSLHGVDRRSHHLVFLLMGHKLSLIQILLLHVCSGHSHTLRWSESVLSLESS